MKRRQAALLSGLAPFLLGGVACAGDLVALEAGSEARYRHRELGYEIGFPLPAEGEYWERFRVDGADLAFRTPTDESPADESTSEAVYSSMSLQSTCRATIADARLLARRLRIGLRRPRLLDQGQTEVDGLSAWMQTFDTEERTRTVRIKTITAPDSDCTFDWILISRGRFEPVEKSFDGWWSSFRRGSGKP